MATIIIPFAMDHATKNAVCFTEKVANEFTPEMIGRLYVQKSCLSEIGYNGGDLFFAIGDEGEITFVMDHTTKNCVAFTEKVESEFTPAKIGKLYVQKFALGKIGYNGDTICSSFSWSC